jgi:hypothetical protein
MNQKKSIAVATLAACAALAAVGSAAAKSAAVTAVTVRVEGLNKELLATKTVKVPASGWITKGGTPKGKCSAASAAGALDVATKHHWNGTYSSSLAELEVISILGESHSFTSKDYWEIFANNKAAQVGACELKLHKGEQLLFAAVSDTATNAYPIAATAPGHASVGTAFKVKVVYYNAKGKATPLSGASVAGKRTNTRGIATIKPTKAGTLVLRATKTGYIRAASVHVAVS